VFLQIRDSHLRPEARSYGIFSRYIGCAAEEITRDMLRVQIGAYF
jgi:hypothetical protein